MNTGSETYTIPEHVAIIMDGNGRWAKRRHMPRIMGHAQGVKTVKRVIEAAKALGIRVLTLYTFSAENWRRSSLEVQALMLLLSRKIQAELAAMKKEGIRLRVIGRRDMLPPGLQKQVARAEEETAGGRRLMLYLALSYGGRWEIVDAARAVAQEVQKGVLGIDDINEEVFASHLYTSGVPDPDLLIRTSGEMRLSNFLLWQLSYAELYFSDVLWPDFTEEHLKAAIEEFNKRERKFGK
ncbi:MAG: isoprenyl transferase [Candidatus Omnitrophica bacterium]|nr:isoprenyl transferase [Candidatus Omnitrophota bacterium]